MRFLAAQSPRARVESTNPTASNYSNQNTPQKYTFSALNRPLEQLSFSTPTETDNMAPPCPKCNKSTWVNPGMTAAQGTCAKCSPTNYFTQCVQCKINFCSKCGGTAKK
ncbi:hypothetical protein PROFUN_09921 [Planoprotostelium fungivorum]|uniref:Uncharacterized protein n=1 Tax=Planoprotostelium fungivorum TaxID=1890364 RepID=A0A2P6NG96_9EUKA|nr:hypothetical protein PROFUN_09921 [Planoprotostelium fungivorum]